MNIPQAYLIRMNLPRWVKKALVILSDLFACIFSVWLSFGLRLDAWGWASGNQWFFYIVTGLVLMLIFFSFGVYQAIFRFSGGAAFLLLIRAFVTYSVIVFLIFTILGLDGTPRAMGIIQPALLFICIGILRFCIRLYLNRNILRNRALQPIHSKVLIYGAGYEGRQLADALGQNPEAKIKGFVDYDVGLQGGTINGIKVYSDENLGKLIRRLEITDVLLAIPAADPLRRREIIDLLSNCHVRVRSMPNLSDIVAGKFKAADLNDLDINDLLGRDEVAPDEALINHIIRNKIVVVTGAGGSIGGELCRQIIKYNPKALILIDINEYSMYLIYEELVGAIGSDVKLSKNNLGVPAGEIPIMIFPYLASVRDYEMIKSIFSSHKPDVVFHAAAYKHVPLVEKNYIEGIRNNVQGTLNCARASMRIGVSQFVLISTDKAVRPTNIMGASKRIAELVLQALSHATRSTGCNTRFSMVRFGNVLGSSGSVVPLFSGQIKNGGPITVTHKDITRYFMTIPEASQLVLQSCAMATGGDIFLLDMGKPVRIYDLAVKMVYLSGLMVKDELHPQGDIEIIFTGLRDGEKLYEELLIEGDPLLTEHPKIMKAQEQFLPWEDLQLDLDRLDALLISNDLSGVKSLLKKLVHGYRPTVHVE